MAIADTIHEEISKVLLEMFEKVGADVAEIETIAEGATLNGWKNYRIAQAAALALPSLAAGASMVGHLALIIPELALLMRFLRVSMLGVGYVKGVAVDGDDFAAILMHSADRKSKTNVVTAKVVRDKVKMGMAAAVAGGATVAPGLVASNLIAGAIVSSVTTISGKAVAPVAAKKAAALLAKMLGGPTAAKAIPFLGAAVGGIANGWITSSLIDDAIAYYDLKGGVMHELGY